MTTENIYKRKSQAYFNATAAGYDQDSGMGLNPELLTAILHKIETLPRANSILDVGCGTGRLLASLQQRIQANLSGLDISNKMVEECRQKLGLNADIRQGDSESIPWEAASFEVVCCTLSFHHYPNPGRALAEMRRVLKPGGVLLLADITFDAPVRQMVNLLLPFLTTGDHHFYSQDEIYDLLEQVRFQSPVWETINKSTFFVSACLP